MKLIKNTLLTVSKMIAIAIGDIFSNDDRDRDLKFDQDRVRDRDRDRNFRDRGHTLQRSQSKTQRFSLINRTFLVVMNFKPPHCHQEAACLQK